MTFYEAALRVLESAGHPLHFQEITDRSIQQSLLSHIGKTPELTMLSRLLAMARRKADRKVVVTAKDTFALADWALPEAPDALTETLKSETREEDNLPPLRPTERHPEPRVENVRVAGRGAERKQRRRDEDDGRKRKRKFPPVPEVVFEILSDASTALKPQTIAERARERELAGDELTDEQILTALLEDNQRRIDAGRRPQFILDPQTREVGLERAGAPSDAPSVELQAAFAAALGIPMEGGRPVLAKTTAVPGPVSEELVQALAVLKTAARDARRAAAKALRRKLADLDAGTFEKSVVKVLHAQGFRELKVAKRSREGPLLTARKREGSLELRYAIRLLKGTNTVDRKVVQELRRDLSHHAAQVALVACPGEVRNEARSEATGQGSLVFIWGGDALADKFLDAEIGVTVSRVESFEVDDRFFESVRVDAEEAQRRREERTREKQQRRGGPRDDADRRDEGDDEEETEQRQPSREAPRPPRAAAPPSAPAAEAPVQARSAGAEDDEGPDDDGDDGEGDSDLDEAEAFVGAGRPEGAAAEGGESGAAGERRRRRRRRRGRRGRGPKPEGAGGTPGQEGDRPAQEAGAAGAAADSPVESVRAESAPPERVAPPEPAAPPPPPTPSPGAGETSGG